MLCYAKVAGMVALAVFPAVAESGPAALKSPNGALEMLVGTVRDGQLAYRVTFRGKVVIDWSDLGLAIEGAPVLGSAVRIESSQTSSALMVRGSRASL